MNRILFVLPIITLLLGCIPIEDFGDYWDKGVIDKDLEGEWKQIGVEHALENQYLSFIQKDGYYEVSAETPQNYMGAPNTPAHCKTLLVGKHKYLMLDHRQNRIASILAIHKYGKEMMEKEGLEGPEELKEMEEYEKEMKKELQQLENSKRFGGLQLYTTDGDVMTKFFINMESLEKAIKLGEVAGSVDDPEDNIETIMPSLKKLDAKTLAFLEGIVEKDDFLQDPVKYRRITDMKSDLKKSQTHESENASDVEVTIDLPDFKYFLDGKVDVLRRQLQASPDFRVVQEGESIICLYRLLTERGEVRANNGSKNRKVSPFHASINARGKGGNEKTSELEYAYRPRMGFVISEKPFMYDAWTPNPLHYKVVSPLAGKIKLDLKSDASGILSDLFVGGPGLWFRISERTAIESRKRTRKAIDDLKKYCAEVRKHEEELINSGYVKSITPEIAIAKGTPRMTIKGSTRGGSFDVHAYVNPGSQGYVFIKMKNMDTGEYFEPMRVGDNGVKEFIGWSENMETLFYYTAKTGLPSRDVIKNTKRISIELWFRPSNGQPSREWFKTEILENDTKLIGVEYTQESQ